MRLQVYSVFETCILYPGVAAARQIHADQLLPTEKKIREPGRSKKDERLLNVPVV